jgi:hypothetical protein
MLIAVGAIMLAYNLKYLSLYMRIRRAEVLGNVVECTGKVNAKIEESVARFRGKDKSTCFPQYRVDAGGKDLYHISPVRRGDVSIGQSVPMLRCVESGLLWTRDEKAAIRVQVLWVTGVMCVFLALMVVSNLHFVSVMGY